MNSKFFKLFIFILYLISPTLTYSIEHPNIKNIILYKEPKKLENIVFQNNKGDIIKLSKFRNKLVVLNFWATWCAPCREEMPSLDKLQKIDDIQNLKILPINIGQEKLEKSKNFFEDLNISNLNLYFDNSINLAKAFALRGLPTSIIINKKGEEIGRIVGSIDFMDKKFIDWLTQVD